MTNKQPEALRLADALQQQAVWEGHYGPSYLRGLLPQAAAELRRLHEENEALQADSDMLRRIGALCRNQTRFTGGYDEIVKCLLAENERLHKALRCTVRTYMVDDQAYDPEAETDRRVKYVMEKVK